jgi:pyruvate dehydrogenase E2 component (dihydrolipoamide acetyltransferase)
MCVGERVKASPYAKKLAREAGVDVGQATASGPQGRIVAADVQKLIESGEGKEAAPSAPKAKEGSSPPAPAHAEVRHTIHGQPDPKPKP